MNVSQVDLEEEESKSGDQQSTTETVAGYHIDWKANSDSDVMGKLEYLRETHNFLLQAPYETLVGIENWELKNIDALRLVPGNVLNDAIMNFFFKVFMQVHLSHQKKDIFIFNTFFWKKLCSVAEDIENHSKTQANANFRFKAAYDKLKVFHKGVELFSKKHLFIPIHKEGHWCAIVITNLPALLQFYNSLSSDGSQQEVEAPKGFSKSTKILQLDPLYRAEPRNGGIARHYLELVLEEALGSKKYHRAKSILGCNPHESLLTYARVPDLQVVVPRQKNRVDCGLFVMEYFESFASNPKAFLQSLDKYGDAHQLFPLSMIWNKRTMLVNILVRQRETESLETALKIYSEEKQTVWKEAAHLPDEYDTESLQQAQEVFQLREEGSRPEFGDYYYATVDGKWTRFVGKQAPKDSVWLENGKKRYRFDSEQRELTLCDVYYSVLPREVALESVNGVEEVKLKKEGGLQSLLKSGSGSQKTGNVTSRTGQSKKTTEQWGKKGEAGRATVLGKRSHLEMLVVDLSRNK